MNTILSHHNHVSVSRLAQFNLVSRELTIDESLHALCAGSGFELAWSALHRVEMQNQLVMSEVCLGSGHRVTVPATLPVIVGVDRNLAVTKCIVEAARALDVFVPIAVRTPSPRNPRTEIFNDAMPGLKSVIPLDFYFGNLLGVSFNNIRVDGSRIEVSFKHPYLATMFEDNLRDLYKDSVLPDGRRDQLGITIKCSEFAGKIVEWIGDARPHWLPGFLLSGPEEFKRGFFVGLLENSGTVCRGKQFYADCATTSLSVARGLYWLAASLGVRATVQQMDEVYRVIFRGIPTQFAKGMNNKWRAIHLEGPDVNPADADRIPISITLAQAIMKRVGRQRHSLQETFRTGAKVGAVSRAKAREALTLLETDLQSIDGGKLWTDLVGNTAIAWSRIDKISPAPVASVGFPILAPGTLGWTSAGGIILTGL